MKQRMFTRAEIIAALIGAAATLLITFSGSLLGYWGQSRAMEVKMVEIAVGILRAEPEANIRPAREWAVDVISEYSEVPMSKAAREALLSHQALSFSDPLSLDVLKQFKGKIVPLPKN